MSVLRQFLPRLITLAVVCAISLFGAVKQAAEPADASLSERPTVIIDAGHGGLTNTI